MASSRSTKNIFLSYGREDEVKAFVRRLKLDLEAAGLSTWLDVDDIPTGSDWHNEIGVALENCRALLAVITKKYVSSRYCKGELYVANGNKKSLFPVIYEEGWKDSPESAGVSYAITSFDWAMFRPGKDDYQKSLARLIEGLKSAMYSTPSDIESTSSADLTIAEANTEGSSGKSHSDTSKEIDNFERRFEELVFEVQTEIEEKCTDLKKFRHSITLLPASIKHEHTKFLKENLSDLKKAENLDEIFMHLNLYWNFIDYGMLEFVVKRYGSLALKQRMNEYMSDLEVFRSATTVFQLFQVWPNCRMDPIPYFSKLTTKLDRGLTEYTLQELDRLRKGLCNELSLSTTLFMLQGVIEGSLIISWHVPSEIVPELRRSIPGVRTGFFQEFGVVSISVDDECLFPQAQPPFPTTTTRHQSSPEHSNREVFDRLESEEVFTADSVDQLQHQVQSMIESHLSKPLSTQKSATESYQWVLFVKTLTGKTIPVKCNETDSVVDIKETLARKERMSVREILLLKRETQQDPNGSISLEGAEEVDTQSIDTVLQDDAMLSSYQLRNGQELILMQMDRSGQMYSPSGYQLSIVDFSVKTSSRELSLRMKASSTILTLKSNVQTLTGLSPDVQQLTLNGRELKDFETLASCNVKNGCVVNLVNVKFQFRVVYVKTLSGKTITVECTAEDTLGKLKAKLHDEEGIAPDIQHLVFAGHLLQDNDRLLTEYHIKRGDTIHLAFKRGESSLISKQAKSMIFVKAPFHLPIPVEVRVSDTVASVKAKVYEIQQISPDQQELVYAGRKLNDTQVLSECGVREGDAIHLIFACNEALEHINIKIFQGIDTRSITVPVQSSDRVADVKRKIFEAESIPQEQQRLIYAGAELQDNQTLGEKNIQNGATVYLCQVSRPVFNVKTLAGKVISLAFDPEMAISEVKRHIYLKEGLASNQQKLVYNGRQLEDDKTLAEHGVSDQATLYVYSEGSAKQVLYIKIPSLRKSVVIDYELDATILSLRTKVQEKERVSLEGHVFLYDGIQLLEDTTVVECGIPVEGTLDLVATSDTRTLIH